MSKTKDADRELALLAPKLRFISKTPLLPTESVEEFEEFSTMLGKGLNTKNIVQDLLAIDARAIAIEVARLRRTKTNLIKMEFPAAIRRLLTDVLGAVDEDKASVLAQNWAADEATREEVGRILANFQLDEYAIEAEATRGLAPTLVALEAMMASLELSKLRILRTFYDCWFNF
jgi:hypothetical protein